MSGHAIDAVLSQLSNDSGRWYLMAYFSCKMIPAKTQYETHNAELLAIVGAVKTWRYYLESCKYKVLVLTHYNNICRFIDMKSLSYRQVWWA